jgi:hypothetical protein
MDIIALLKAERDRAAQQVNALDVAIRGTERIEQRTPIARTAQNERRCPSKNFGISKSTLGKSTEPKGCLHRSQAAHLSGRSSADQSGSTGTVAEGETAEVGLFLQVKRIG